MKNVAFILMVSLFIISCTEPNQNRKKANLDETESEKLKTEAEAPLKKSLNKAYFPIPSPEQMFGFINDNGVDYAKSLTNSAANESNYTDPTSKALNFGVYTADLAYAAAYQDIETTLELYTVVKKIGSDLNIEEMMNDEMLQEVQAHLEDKDSLTIIAGQSYYQAVEFMERNEMQGKLALMSLGGWVESMYITLNAINGYDENEETTQRIADQKVTFGNLYTYLKKNESFAGVKEAIANSQEIRSVFASLKEEKAVKATQAKDSKKMVFGGDKRILITKEQFAALKMAINNLRATITGQSA
tara:strand:- start:14193 stop:15098 length:906 start_codon:yes stop_codon:yes gene_type:complete